MYTTVLLKLAVAFLLMIVGAIGFTKKFAELWCQENKIPKILLDLLLGFCLLFPQIAFVIGTNYELIDFSKTMLIIFENFPFLFLFIPGILAFFKPLSFNKPAAIYEVPLLFAICLVYLLFGISKEQNSPICNYSLLLIFLFFCFDMLRMKELGNYDSPMETNFSEKRTLVKALIWALFFSAGLVTIQKISVDLLNLIYDNLLLNILYFVMLALPYLCMLIIMLLNKVPCESFIRGNVLRCIIFCSLLLPIDMILHYDVYQHIDTNILTLDTLILGFLWYCITCLKKINRLTGVGMLVAYIIYLYYILR